VDSASRPPIDLDALTELLALADSWTPLTLGAAAALGITDDLTEGPRSIQDLARKTGARPDALFRMLRLLSSRGVFRLVDGQRVALTAPAQFLRSDHPMSLRDMLSPMPEFLLAWSRAVDAVRSGKTGWESPSGPGCFLPRRPPGGHRPLQQDDVQPRYSLGVGLTVPPGARVLES
jgi:hypothetical protein